jgi:hypothetical protein
MLKAMLGEAWLAMGANRLRTALTMLGMVIGALKIGIAVKAAAAAFDFDLGPFEAWPDIGKVGEMVAYAVVGAFVAMAAVVAAAAYPYYSVINAIAQLQTDVRIIDFVDAGHPALLRMWDKRQRGYRAMGYRMGADDVLA